MRDFSRKDHTITFVDTCPSELIHSLTDKILIFSHINYDNIEFDEIRLRQFKKTRTIERKLKAQDYVIECFESKKITGYGIIRWNTQKLALHNASTLLISSGFITASQLHSPERIEIAGENVSVGHLLSLAWYAVLLSLCPREISIWTKRVEGKEKSLILMDLLPGDSIDSSRNLNIVRFIIKNSILDGLFSDAIKDKKLQHIAFGYGSKEGSTKDLKKSPPSTISDWITQSFYCKLRCEKIIKDELFESNIKFSKLADYLIEKKFFLIDPPFRLTE
jgi:hypothetical protein